MDKGGKYDPYLYERLCLMNVFGSMRDRGSV